MDISRIKFGQSLKKFKFFIFILLITGSIPLSSLNASTTYTTSILNNKENDSIFINAIKSEDVKAIKSLINSGADLNERNKYGHTPLMAAVCKGNVEIIDALISAGADLEEYDDQGNTAIMYALYNNEDRSAALTFLLSLNVNLKIMNNQEQTPLILATLNNHCNSIKLLIKAGANIEAKGKSGGTALLHAVENQNIEPAKLLIKNGANLETKDNWGFTPLMLAAFGNDGALIRILLKAGADINARTSNSIPISLKKDWQDFFPKTVYIPIGSTALDISKQFEKRFAETVLTNQGAEL